MKVSKNEKLGSIVARNFQAATIFNVHSIDYYSRGDRTLEHACVDGGLSPTAILEELEDLKSDQDLPDMLSMDLARLSTHIVRTHHKFAEKKVVFIRHTLDRLSREVTTSFKKVEDISTTFDELATYLTVHMKHEEFIIFPFIQAMAKGRVTEHLEIGNLQHPVKAMTDDHLHEVATLEKLARITNNYALPTNADYGWRITYGAMKELEEDLKIHMHLENNILFPRAVRLANASNYHPA